MDKNSSDLFPFIVDDSSDQQVALKNRLNVLFSQISADVSLHQYSLQDQAAIHRGHEQGEVTSCLPCCC